MEYRAVNKSDPSTELTHWKYIKREKQSNGKYRYYYDLPSGKQKTSKVLTKASDVIGEDERAQLKDSESKRDYYVNTANANLKEFLNAPPSSTTANEAFQYSVHYTELAVKAQKVVDKCLKEYNKTPLGKLENAINKGKSLLTSLFTKRRTK